MGTKFKKIRKTFKLCDFKLKICIMYSNILDLVVLNMAYKKLEL